jgi:nucleoside-diphosphate-sugar epimerase
MKVFLAGATGVLGRPTVERLVAAGHEVTGVARGPEKAALLRSLGATPVEVDLYDPAAVTEAVAGHDAVIHMATKIPPAAKMAMPGAWHETDRLRREATVHMVDAALATGAQAFIKESITFTYADGGDGWVDESAPDDVAPYLASSLVAEEETRRFAAGGGRGVVLRFAAFYGPVNGQTQEMIGAVQRGVAPALGDPDGYFSIIHTDDAAAAVVAALDVPSGTYNVGDDEPLTRKEWGRALAAAYALDPPRSMLAKAPVLLGSKAAPISRSHRISNAKLKEASGWSPIYPGAREGWRAVAAAEGSNYRAQAGGRGGWPAILSQLALLMVAVSDLVLGVWAAFFPRAFYDLFPGMGWRWVSVDGPFNQHFIRDFGDFNLALAVVTIVALVRFTPTTVRTAAAAAVVWGLPHLVYHVTHQAGLSGPSLVSNIGVLVYSTFVLPAVMIWGVSGAKAPDVGGPGGQQEWERTTESARRPIGGTPQSHTG